MRMKTSMGMTSSKSLLVILLALAALLVGIYVQQQTKEPMPTLNSDDFNGTVLTNPRAISEFSLVDQNGQVFSKQNLQGRWSLVYFGFTNCPHVCPLAMTRLSEVYAILEKKGLTQLPQVVLISVDPERDSVEKMRQYVSTFHEDFVGVTGEREQMNKLTAEIGVAHMKVVDENSTDPNDYNVEHSGAIMLFNQNGDLAGFFTTPHEPEKIAEDLIRLVG